MTIDHIAALKPDRRNARQHNPRNIDMLTRSLQEVGAARSIVIDEDDNILAGNGTIEAAAQVDITRLKVVEADGNEIVAVRRRGLTPEQKQRLALYDNRTAELADWDTDVLAELRSEDALDGLFFDDELDALLAAVDAPEPGDGGDDFDTTPADGPTRVQPGDLWRIGPHRLLCGDATRADDVVRLMGGEKASLIYTDPPWNVDYTGGTKRREALANDNIEVGWAEWLTGAFAAIREHAIDNCPAYVFFGLMKAGDTQLGIEAAGWRIVQTLVWVKQHAQFGNFRAHYKYQHEPMYYCSTGAKVPEWYGPNNEVSIWECNRSARNDFHPTQKPIELAERAIGNSTGRDVIVADLFGGGGATVVAAHRKNRKARIMEIEPKYCDVILRRAEAEGIGPIELVGNSGT